MRRNIGRDKGRRGIRKERDGDSKKYDNEILKEEDVIKLIAVISGGRA